MPESIKITKKSDLPVEFSIEKYAGTANFTAADWANAISLRKLYLPVGRQQESFLNFLPNEKQMLELFADPLRHPRLFNFYEKDESNHTSLRRVSVLDVLIENDTLREYKDTLNLVKKIERNADEVLDGDQEGKVDPRVMKFARSPIDQWQLTRETSFTLNIDLKFSDKQIVEDFTSALKKERRERVDLPAKFKSTVSRMRKWHVNASLPYVDLTIWSQIVGKKIGNQLMGTILFPYLDPGQINLADKVEDTVRKHAQDMLSNSTFPVLRRFIGKVKGMK